MAQKRINDLQLRSDFDETCSFPVDDLVQTWRVTGAQVLTFIQSLQKLNVSPKTAAYTLDASIDNVILADASGGAFTLTLPAISGITGKVFVVKKTDSTANVVTIDGNGSETIDGAIEATLYNQYESIRIVATTTGWSVI